MNKRIIMMALTVSAAASGMIANTAQAQGRGQGEGQYQGQYQGQSRWDFTGGRNGEREVRLVGPGVPILFPELRGTPRGRAFVLRNFDMDHNGVISRREADAANRAFIDVAGQRRDHFNWDARDRPDPRPMIAGPMNNGPRPSAGGWDRRAMHDYRFRQTPRGATLNLSEDVLFATDSDVLRPGALDKLRPLSAYLQDQRGVQVAIDGYTDARGSDTHNQYLSERRAASVRNALADMGVTRARFKVIGHGERDPIASNTTTEGMKQNRRVEVTLLGQQARTFDRVD